MLVVGWAEVSSRSIEGYFLRRNVPDLLKEFVLIIIGSGATLFFSKILEQERKSLEPNLNFSGVWIGGGNC